MLTVHVEAFGWEEQIVHGLYMRSHVNMSTWMDGWIENSPAVKNKKKSSGKKKENSPEVTKKQPRGKKKEHLSVTTKGKSKEEKQAANEEKEEKKREKLQKKKALDERDFYVLKSVVKIKQGCCC